ncbi:16925_t:CDS:2 [Funneliformis geosporum]|uniref:10727_t:CDS:1 n=1 Tax=Funneliformis geosporum TaxID=1117311 RepID=A0A9W4T1D6_9GLOM|nr:10727_t:CDS:2 [Funneliformis geosporum]CAI2188887.1 16925_t:CDS:2 [Funneliformis geosporum]
MTDNKKVKGNKVRRLSTELFELGRNTVHSFIMDVDDVIIRQHFIKTELDEIDDVSSLQIPKLSDEIDDI